jgi:hypothetical protein
VYIHFGEYISTGQTNAARTVTGAKIACARPRTELYIVATHCDKKIWRMLKNRLTRMIIGCSIKLRPAGPLKPAQTKSGG